MPRKPRTPRHRGSARPNDGPPRRLVIDRLGARGDGIADGDRGPVFVAGALPGETVTAQIGAARGDGQAGHLIEVLHSAPARVTPPCPYAPRCGGCQLQHLAMPAYSAWKQALVTGALANRGITPNPDVIRPILTVPPHSRRRVVLAARRLADRVVLGFNERRSSLIVDISSCLVAHKDLTALLAPLRALLAALLARGGKADIALTLLDDGVDMVLIGGPQPDLAAREALAAFAGEQDLARLSWAEAAGSIAEPIAHRRDGLASFTVEGTGFAVAIPPGGFLQATRAGERTLQTIASAATIEATRVADLFAGAGTFTAPILARGAHVLAVDGVAAGLDALTDAARRAGHGERLSAQCRDLFTDPLPEAELRRFDAVIIDPPRAGAAAQTAEIAGAGVPTVVSVSCNPATFARDARLLIDAGYRLDLLQPVDQFIWSGHLELAAVFRRGNGA